MQCVVRTYIDKYTNPTSSLSRKLREGYKVLMVYKKKYNENIFKYLSELYEDFNNSIRILIKKV